MQVNLSLFLKIIHRIRIPLWLVVVLKSFQLFSLISMLGAQRIIFGSVLIQKSHFLSRTVSKEAMESVVVCIDSGRLVCLQVGTEKNHRFVR
jgi:phosphoribosylformimino-5-aminoimidazole carboxamide ribonucleotide (ProFAR) isomerase